MVKDSVIDIGKMRGDAKSRQIAFPSLVFHMRNREEQDKGENGKRGYWCRDISGQV